MKFVHLKKALLLLLVSLSVAVRPHDAGVYAQPPPSKETLATWTHTTQADWMAGERRNLDVRGLDALGTPYGLDGDPRGAMRLASQPGMWTKHPSSPIVVPGAEGAWDDATISEAKVIYDGARFHMWYAGRRRGPPGLKTPMDLGYAVSQDGVQWSKPQERPVLVRGPVGGYDENMITAPAVLYDGERFHMWFSAVDFGGDWSINYASSPDGLGWQKSVENPLLQETHDARWDADYVAEPCVLFNGEGFEMWYNGASTADASKETVIGHATSPDGIAWERSLGDGPAFDVGPDGAWDDYAVARPHVMYNGEQYKLWYEGHSGGTWRIGYATSPDGVIWTRSPKNPIVDLGPEGAWDSEVVSEPFVLYDGQVYRLFHSGYDGDRYRVGLVTAPPVYADEGVYLSPPLESDTPVQWGTLTADAAIPAGTSLRFAVSGSDDGQAWSEWVDAGAAIEGAHPLDLTGLDLPDSRYLRYRATLRTDDSALSPVVREIVVAEAAPDFVLDVAPKVALDAGGQGEVTLSLEAVRGFEGTVSVRIEGLADGLTASWPVQPLPLPASTTILLGAAPSGSMRTIPLTITARSGTTVHRAPLSVQVAAPTPTATSVPAPTVAPTPEVQSAAVAIPPADPQPLWLGGGLVGAGIVLALFWIGALVVVPAAGEGKRRWWRHWVWALLPVVVCAAGVLVPWRYIEQRRAEWDAFQSYIRPGVQAAGIDAGGMTEDELRQAIEAREVAPYRREIAVRYGDRTAMLDTGDLEMQTNLDQIVEQAVTAGQDVSDEAFRTFLFETPPPLDLALPLTRSFDYGALDPWMEDLAAEVERPVVEHSWNPETLTFVRGQAGARLDTERAVERVREAIPDLSNTAVELAITRIEPQAWTDDEIATQVSLAEALWREPPQPAAIEQITISFDAERWIGPGAPASDWEPTRPMTGYAFDPGQQGWMLDGAAARAALRTALDAGAPVTGVHAFVDLDPAPLALDDIKGALLDVAGHFDGLTGFYVQDLATGQEIRHNTHITTSGMSMIKVAIMATAYRIVPRPFSDELQDALSEMIAHSINEKSNAVILEIGEGDFSLGLERVNETLSALGMHQTYIASGYRVEEGPSYAPIDVPERPPVDVPEEERVDLWPDTAMQTSLSDQAIMFEALYRGASGEGRLLEAYPALTAEDCQEMLDLLKTNPVRTLLAPGFADQVPVAHKNGFGGGQYTDERMDVGIVWPPDGRPYLVGLYQWDKQAWIHWLRVWPQQIEFSTTLYNYFTMPPPRPAANKPPGP